MTIVIITITRPSIMTTTTILLLLLRDICHINVSLILLVNEYIALDKF